MRWYLLLAGFVVAVFVPAGWLVVLPLFLAGVFVSGAYIWVRDARRAFAAEWRT